MPIRRLILLGLLCLSPYAEAQIRACAIEPHALPDDLRSSLEGRLSTFLMAQGEENWGEVADLLGRCRFGCNTGSVYTISYNQCLVSRIQELRMLDFHFSIHDLSTCSTKMDLPAGAMPRFAAEQLSWYVRGTATFQTSSEEWTAETQVIAYRDQGQWYFIPPQQAMQDKWEKIHYTEADFGRDRRDEIEIPNPPSSPIEITDVHVYMDRQFPSLRNINFTLRNKTSKRVVALSLRIGDETGETDMAGPYEIQPMANLAEKTDSTAYADFCEGIRKPTMTIQEVHFADGSKWEFKQSRKSEQ
jgi:hypothetical protein